MRSRPQWKVRLLLLPAIALLPWMPGCTPSVIDGGFDSPMAASRLYAIERAVREGDTTSIRQIIEQLESDDPLVRMTAIGALERLTGQTYGYHHDDPLLARREAIRRWREAYESGEVAATLDERVEMSSLENLWQEPGMGEGANHG